MTLTQLEYVVALAKHRHFAAAAEICFVTQPTLSMQIHKLEEELGVQIFDRSMIPVEATKVGERIIEQARIILAESKRIQEIIHDEVYDMKGTLRFAVIPTLAPYLLPLFLSKFLNKYPEVNLVIQETTTEQIIKGLRDGSIDVAILATPLNKPFIKEFPVFYEPFVAYLSKEHPLYNEEEIDPNSIAIDNVWLLNESHCFRSQVFDMCKNFQGHAVFKNVQYESGSLETLKKLVDVNNGITFLPQLATLEMKNEELEKVRYFQAPEPVREVSLVVNENFGRKKIIQSIIDEVVAVIPSEMKISHNKRILSLRMS